MRDHRTGPFLFILVLLFASIPAGAAEIAEADTAFNAGRYDEALRLYDEVLEDDPDNLRALIQSAKLLSWEQQFADAVARYDHVLTIDPAEPTARLERAKVLSWSKRYREAIEAFGQILADDPTHVDAQLGIARVKSWSGNQLEARAEYQKILDRDPSNISAMVGVAQTYAWSGEEATAREWYDRILATDPDQRSALLGTAYLDLSIGDLAAATGKAQALEARYPNDDEIIALSEAIDRGSAPTYQLSGYRIEDTDDNEVERYGITAGFAFPNRLRLDLGYFRYDMRNEIRNQEAGLDNAYLGLTWRPSAIQRLVLRAGIDQLETTDGETDTEPTGLFIYSLGVGGKVETSLVAERRALRYTTTSIDQGILIDAYSSTLVFRPAPRWTLTGGIGLWDVSDGNERISYDGEIAYRWPVSSWRVSTDYQFRYFDFDQNLDNGYFDPKDFMAHSIRLSLGRDFGERFYANGMAETGIQSFELGTVEIDDDQFLTTMLMLGYRITPELSIEAQGTSSDAAVQSTTGFESDEYSVRLRWQPY